MKTISKNSEWNYHTWRDIGGITGLILNAGVCAIVIVASVFMILVGGALLVADYVATAMMDTIGRWTRA